MQTLLAGYASDDKDDIKEADPEKEDDHDIEDEGGDNKHGLKVIVEDSDMTKHKATTPMAKLNSIFQIYGKGNAENT